MKFAKMKQKLSYLTPFPDFFSVALLEVTNVDEIFSPLRMQNYLSDKEKPPVQWIDMGDTGHMDERGNLVVSGRSKDVLVLKNSSKINTNTVERLLQKCDAVLEACFNKLSIRLELYKRNL